MEANGRGFQNSNLKYIYVSDKITMKNRKENYT